MLVAIEGADGVGKNTTAIHLRDTLVAAGRSATIIGFPRYGETLGGVTIGRLLAGEMPVPASAHAAAVLYALDRFEWRGAIAMASEAYDVVIFDRYIASNMAYQAARIAEAEARGLMDWILALETGQFALPRPVCSIYLYTPWEHAREFFLKKAVRSYTDRSFD
jgi:dTMP kinase